MQGQERKLNLLIIDDSVDDVFLIRHTLKKAGIIFTSTHVETCQELNDTLATQDWDVVITDHHMNGFSSAEAINIIRAYNEALPVIIVSGEIAEETAISAMHCGAQDFVMKDNLARLVPVIMREYKQHELEKAHQTTEEKYRFLRYHDKLTSLVNRHEFEARISRALQEVKKSRDIHVMMFLDLDQFKLVNDTCGHTAGDELLVRVTKIFQSVIRDRDTLARLGGDEFGILLQHCQKNEAMEIARRIKKEVKESKFVWEGNTFETTISIGMVEINEYAHDYREVLSCADIACYAAKDRGRDAVVWFSPEDEEYNKRRSEMQWVPRIKQAAKEDKFILYHQPMQGLQDNFTAHEEFLVRLQGDDGLIPPFEFIPAAERYNLMPVIDRWVVKHVFEYLQKSGHGQDSEGMYFINLSGSTLSDQSFFDDIKAWQKEFQVKPERVCFEITETAAIDNLVDAVEFINEIRDLGFKFALDDFGVGLSSFSYLKTIPVDYLKIDGSFVKNMINNEIDRGIVEACNSIAHAAGLITVAEFVESDEIKERLKGIGVDFVQGFGVVKPKPIPVFQ
jgi:diguanylate cyclase (GGDEF)-like protein